MLLVWLVTAVFVQGCGEAQTRPQVVVERLGEPYPALPPDTLVKVFQRGEPNESYREIGRITASCPEQRWTRGQQVKGRPVCIDGLRQGARKLGAQVVVEVETERTRPPWEPEARWLIMRGVAVRFRR